MDGGKRKPFHGSFSSRLSESGKFLIDRLSSYKDGINFRRLGRLALFYLILYGVIVIFSFNLYWFFGLTLNPRTPTRLLTESLIGTNPGLGFRPRPADENVLSTLIWYQGTKNESFHYWTKNLVDFLEVYKKPGLTPGRGQNMHACSDQNPPGPGKVCDVNVKDFDPCIEENYFMYNQAGPCIFLKLNKVYGWRPKFYKDPTRLPHDMPEDLKNQIATYANSSLQSERLKLNTVWVSCEGESPADAEFIRTVKYHPKQGFPGYFFPYENSEGYLSPLVAVQFVKPRAGILINIECRAWAENIVYSKRDRQGSIHFELMID